MRCLPRLALTLAALAAALPASATQAPSKASGDSSASANAADSQLVTQKNLLESERYWPYHVALVEAWTASGAEKPLSKGTRGVLIRVEPSGLARVDFGRGGLHEVPVAKTDLLQSANRIRERRDEKTFPNFVLSIGPRLVDPEAMMAPGPAKLAAQRVFLCVFADPNAKDFVELAKTLVSLPERTGASLALFAQGEQTDLELAKRLRSLGWKGTFVLTSMSQAYTRSLLPEGVSPPFLQLVTSEGRVLFEGRWDASSLPKLTAALDAEGVR